jgi:hypothetical protein
MAERRFCGLAGVGVWLCAPMRTDGTTTRTRTIARSLVVYLVQDGADPLFEQDLSQRRRYDFAILDGNHVWPQPSAVGIDVKKLGFVFHHLATRRWNRSAGPPSEIVAIECHPLGGSHFVRSDVVHVDPRRFRIRIQLLGKILQCVVTGPGAFIGDDHDVLETVRPNRAAHAVIGVAVCAVRCRPRSRR